MSKKINLKILLLEIWERVREFYPYFLGFYLLSLLVAVFSKTWSSFFYWPAFHGSVIFFTLLFLLTFKFKSKLKFKRLSFNFKKINRRTWIKIIIIAAVLIFSLVKQIGVSDFLILFYALISILFILDSRYSAGAALVFLAACPVLLIFKYDAAAESSAIFAYYFLVITVLTQIIEIRKEKQVI